MLSTYPCLPCYNLCSLKYYHYPLVFSNMHQFVSSSKPFELELERRQARTEPAEAMSLANDQVQASSYTKKFERGHVERHMYGLNAPSAS